MSDQFTLLIYNIVCIEDYLISQRYQRGYNKPRNEIFASCQLPRFHGSPVTIPCRKPSQNTKISHHPVGEWKQSGPMSYSAWSIGQESFFWIEIETRNMHACAASSYWKHHNLLSLMVTVPRSSADSSAGFFCFMLDKNCTFVKIG